MASIGRNRETLNTHKSNVSFIEIPGIKL